MDPNTVLILLKTLDIASAAFARLSTRDVEGEAFVAKVREIIREKGGKPSDEDFADLVGEGDATTQLLEALLASRG
jgi:hypothetical protein